MYSAHDTHRWVGFPIRTSADQRSLASPRGLSQRATSFIASWRQGIHRTPLSRSRTIQHRPRAGPNRARCSRTPARPSVCSASAGTTHASANFTHISDTSPNPTARPPHEGAPEPQGRTPCPPDPIHRLKEHAHPRTRVQAQDYQRERTGHPTQKATQAMQWRLAGSNR